METKYSVLKNGSIQVLKDGELAATGLDRVSSALKAIWVMEGRPNNKSFHMCEDNINVCVEVSK